MNCFLTYSRIEWMRLNSGTLQARFKLHHPSEHQSSKKSIVCHCTMTPSGFELLFSGSTVQRWNTLIDVYRSVPNSHVFPQLVKLRLRLICRLCVRVGESVESSGCPLPDPSTRWPTFLTEHCSSVENSTTPPHSIFSTFLSLWG